jgi:hypothetical protein
LSAKEQFVGVRLDAARRAEFPRTLRIAPISGSTKMECPHENLDGPDKKVRERS